MGSVCVHSSISAVPVFGYLSMSIGNANTVVPCWVAYSTSCVRPDPPAGEPV